METRRIAHRSETVRGVGGPRDGATVPSMSSGPGHMDHWLSTPEAIDMLHRAPKEVAPLLLGALVTGPDGVVLRVVEVEAYSGAGDDPASHAHRGRTDRNAAMFGPVGHLYAYRSYGIHTCLNVVAHPVDGAGGVLLRAGEVVQGHGAARRGRDHLSEGQLASGPGRLGTTLGFSVGESGRELLTTGLLRLPRRPAGPVSAGPRVGISRATARPWRYWLDGHPAVTRYRPG